MFRTQRYEGCARTYRRSARLPWLLLAAGILACLQARAADAFPDRPLTIVVPFPAAGGTDLTARLFAQALERQGGQPVTVLNRPGAGGEVGMAQLARASADGYTLGLLNTPNVLSIPIERKAQFALSSFEPVVSLVDDPATLSVHASSQIRSVADLVRAARAAPDAIRYGTAGVGSAGHLSVLMLEKQAGIRMLHVPYKGTSDVRTALLGEQIVVAATNLGEALAFAPGSPWRTLGVMSPARSGFAPDLPTFAESGYALSSGSLRGIGAPAGLPPDRREQLRALVTRAAADPAFQSAAQAANQELKVLAGERYAEALAGQQAALQQLWAATPWNR